MHVASCSSAAVKMRCVCVVWALCLGAAAAWDPDQLEVFDVVEEVNQNFYQLLNISQDADNQQIKRAFRNLSLVLHPDKNSAPDADVQFRNLVSVYEVLRNENKRKHYDDVLVNGLPNWRSAMYYYRHYRKMGLAEMVVILFTLVTIAQYLIAWASYFEKKYTHEQVYQAKIEKKLKKLSKKGQNVEEFYEAFEIPKPSIKNTLPFQIPKLIFFSIVGIPSFIKHIREISKEQERLKQEQAEEARLQKELELEAEQKKQRDKNLRKRRAPAFPLEERPDLEEIEPTTRTEAPQNPSPRAPVVSGGLWTDDDLAELVLLVKRYPGGTSDRWETIAEHMYRQVSEVTYMAAKLKENGYRLPGNVESEANVTVEEIPKKQKTKGGKVAAENGANSEEWSQTQQKALEAAIVKHPKGPADRWEKIAKCVPEKTKEECMLRYKYLVELVKKRKEIEEPETQ